MKLPSGIVTFLFTDIEGSTRLWENHPEAMRVALARHDALLRQSIENCNGHVFKTVGDAFCAAFAHPSDAVAAALQCHLLLQAEDWGDLGGVRVRIGIHTGRAEERDGDYFGPTLNRVARLQGIGHGQQTLISQATCELLGNTLPTGARLEDLGQHRLKDLLAPEHVWQLLHPVLPDTFPPLKSLDYLPTNLQPQVSSFIGRAKEMVDIKELLGRTRLLTLTGTGGTGKTRLSMQAAAEVLDRHPDGVWLVELASISDPALISHAVAVALSIREVPGEALITTLLSALKDRRMLLVLDNCEHLLEGAARLVDTLLRSCPGVRVLASSREAMRIAGESVYRVPSLSVPDLKHPHTPQSVSGFESVRLFVERASAARADFTLTPQNTPALASVCHRLDGVPLAIELAAARVRSLPIEEINTRLDNRFRLLTGGSRTALPRQQTLRALIDWSYDLLTAQEKALFCRLSVFTGGWTLEAAEAVCAGSDIEDWELLDLLTSLVDKSLVVFEEREAEARYRLLETVRQYGQERLRASQEGDAVLIRHRDYFLALAEMAEAQLLGPAQVEWLQRLEAEHENLRAALDGSIQERQQEMESEEALRLCGALSRFWTIRGYYAEGRQWCARVLAMQTDTPPGLEQRHGRAKTLHGAGTLALRQGDYASSRKYHEESLAIHREIGDKCGMGDALNNLGVLVSAQGDDASALPYHQESLICRREVGDQSGVATSLNNLGNIAYRQGDYSAARTYCAESVAIQREIGNRAGLAQALNSLGNVAYYQGDYASAHSSYAESLVIRRELGEPMGIAMSLTNLGNLAYLREDVASARASYEESLAIQREIGDRQGMSESLHNLGSVAAQQKDYPAALSYQKESMAICKELVHP